MSITLNGTTGIIADSPATVKADAFLDASGGNTATINGMTPVGTTATQTLTNKTLTSPTITGGSLSGTSGAITRGTAQASTSGTAIDFTGIPSWASRITVLFADVSSSGTSEFLVQIGAGSFTTSGYNSSSGKAQSGGTTTVTNSSSGYLIGIANASQTLRGTLQMSMLGNNQIVANGIFTTQTTMISSAGLVSIAGAIDRVRITTVSGTDTFDAGTINIMYEG